MRCFSSLIAGVLLLMPSAWSMSVALASNVGSEAPIGTAVQWQAAASDAASGDVVYRFRLMQPDATSYRTVVDFSPSGTFDWFPMQAEGLWNIEVTALDRQTGESKSQTISFRVTPRVIGNDPVITGTRNELVYIYSAPPCADGSSMRVQFDAPDGFRQFTPLMPCASGKNMNTYIAGLRPGTEYKVRHVIVSRAATVMGPEVTFTSGTPKLDPAATTVLMKPSGTIRQGILLQSKVFEYNVATDFDGNLIWFCPAGIKYLTRPEPGGYFFAISGITGAPPQAQYLRQIDLGSNIILETNAARINDQLDELREGFHITSFHHEARRLPNGKIMVLAATEHIFTDTQGPGDVDVIGDVILILNKDLQVDWVWNAFNHMDVTRAAILDETCAPGGGGCPEFSLAPIANDWLHGNALQLTDDGNILYSARHQDWVLKIDYQNGQGTGDVLWRLGRDGDFQLDSSDPDAWFSHQHDPNFETGDNSNRLVVFDNGNTRQFTNPDATSRGQVLEVDEANRTAKLVLNVDLGTFSTALGSAQKLTTGTYHFDLGWAPNGHSAALEYDANGNLVSKIEVDTQQYRSFRMRDLYTP